MTEVRRTDGTVNVADGRTVCFADHGLAAGMAVVWCHGGPGCRLEPEAFARLLQRIAAAS